MASKGRENFFQYPSVWFILTIPLSMLLLAMMTFVPDLVPYGYLGPLGSLSLYMVTNVPSLVKFLFFGMIFIHIGEAFYGYNKAKSKGLNKETSKRWAKWILVYGVFSLNRLMAYNPEAKLS